MKRIGLIGGMTWESTLEYYRIINEQVKARLGGFHSGRILMDSLDFDEIEKCQSRGDWDESARILGDSAERLERAGADLFLICTNTMHKVADAVAARVRIPLLHIVDVTARRIMGAGLRKVGLLGTRFTMEEDFYKGRLAEKFGLTALIPGPEERAVVDGVIYNELTFGIISPESRGKYVRTIEGLAERGAQGVILGCTEIPLLVRQEDVRIPVFDTTRIHAEAAVEAALGIMG
jgi:aspartate racemase